MTPEAQRIAIAEACGWTPFQKHSAFATAMWFPPNEKRMELQFTTRIPDYLNDLNAMHEAEKVLTGDQCKLYFRTLFDVVGNSLSPMNMVHATATQRAEAFLLTLGLWKE